MASTSNTSASAWRRSNPPRSWRWIPMRSVSGACIVWWRSPGARTSASIAGRSGSTRRASCRFEPSTNETREIDGVTTPISARFDRPLDGEVVHMTVEAVDYRSPIPDSFFSTLELIRRR